MQHTTTLTKWGSGQGVRIPKEIIDLLKLKIGDEVSITADENQIIIRKSIKRVTINELFADYTENFKPEEIKWGAMGKEL